MAAQKAKKKVKKTAASKPAAADKILQLDKELNIKGVVELKEKLAATLRSGNPVKIDAGGVEAVDTAALQLLVAFARHAEAQDSAIRWVHTSTAFADSARLMDLDQHLGLGSASA